MRRSGELPWSFIADGTRWQRKPSTWESSADYVEAMSRELPAQPVAVARRAHRDLAGEGRARRRDHRHHQALGRGVDGQPRPVERHVPPQCRRGGGGSVDPGRGRDVHLHAVRPRPRRGAASAADDRARPAKMRRMREACRSGSALAVTPQQITAWNLPTRPGKSSDTQAKEWGNRPNVELDAIDPNQLSQLVETRSSSTSTRTMGGREGGRAGGAAGP